MGPMTSRERVSRVLAGELPDRVPVLLQNFQNTAQLAGIPLNQFCQDSSLMAEAQIAAWERFRYDVLDIENGTTAMAGALGCEVDYPEDQPPRLVSAAIDCLEDVDKLEPVDPTRDGTLPQLLRTTRLVAEGLNGQACIVGEADQGPFDLASMLVGMEKFLLAVIDPDQSEQVHNLLEFCSEQVKRLALAQIDAGADFTEIGEPFAGPDLCAPKIYREFAFPYEKRLVADLKGCGVPLIIHMCGDSTRIISDMADTGAPMLEVDSKIDAVRCSQLTQGRSVLVGNVDTTLMARGRPDQVVEAARQAIRDMGQHGWFILSPGCTIGATTPFESTEALMEAVDRFGRYDDVGLITD